MDICIFLKNFSLFQDYIDLDTADNMVSLHQFQGHEQFMLDNQKNCRT